MADRVHVAVPDGYADQLAALAYRLRRLSPNYTNPERFHLEKDEIAQEMMSMARRR